MRYLEIQQLNHDFSFSFKMITDNELPVENILIPPMLLHPYVENAIIHGALSTEDGMIEVICSIKDETISVIISDDGKISKSTEKESKKLNRSMGMDILNKRMENLREMHQFTIEAHVNSNQDGTTILLDIPLKYGNFQV